MTETGLTVLQIIPRLNAGGAERGATDVAAAVIKAGGRAIIVSEGGRLVKELLQLGGEHITLPVASKSPFVIRRNKKILEDIIREQKADIVHARSRAPAWSAYYAAKSAGVPFVTTYHGLYSENNFFKKAYNKIMTRGAAIIAVSDFIAENVAKRYPKAKEKIHVIRRGIDMKLFSPELVTRQRMEAIIKQWNLDDDMRFVITLPGRITRIKGHYLLIEAIKELKKIRNDFVCVCPGDIQGDKDRYAAKLLETVRNSELNSFIRFPGPCLDMPAAYAVSNVIVVPTIKPEAFGRVPVEAQVMGKLVVAAEQGGLSETIENGVTGFLFTPGDPVALAQTLNRALNASDEERRQAALIGRKRAETHYTCDRMCADTLALYEKVCQRTFPVKEPLVTQTSAPTASTAPETPDEGTHKRAAFTKRVLTPA